MDLVKVLVVVRNMFGVICFVLLMMVVRVMGGKMKVLLANSGANVFLVENRIGGNRVLFVNIVWLLFYVYVCLVVYLVLDVGLESVKMIGWLLSLFIDLMIF